MSYLEQKESSQQKNYIQELERDHNELESQKETLFKQTSAEINFLIRQLTKLGGLFQQKNMDLQGWKRESVNWTTSTQKSRQNVFRTTQIIFKRQNQLGYSDQTLRQKLDQLIEREFLLEQKFFIFITKLDDWKQKYQHRFQKIFQLKQSEDKIKLLEQDLQNQKTHFRTQLQNQISQTTKVQKRLIESQYNKKITQIKQEYEEKTLQNIRKYESIILLLQEEKDKIFSLMEQEISSIKKNYQPKLQENKSKLQENKSKTPQKTRKISLQKGGRFKTSSPQKNLSENLQKINAQNQKKIKSLNEKIQDLQETVKKLKDQNAKLITKIECYQIKNKQQMNRIQEKDTFINEKSEEITKINQKFEDQSQSCTKLQKIAKSQQAKIANLAEELKRSKKANQEIRELSARNMKNMQKQIEQMRRELTESKKIHLNLSAQLDTVKHEIKQKQIRIESMDRQLQRTKNYNQILTKQNITLNQTICGLAKNQSNSNLLKIPQLSKDQLQDLQSLRNSNQIQIPHLNLHYHTKSLANIFQHEYQSEQSSEVKPRVNTSRFNRIHEEDLTEERRRNSLGRELNLPLMDLKDGNRSNGKDSSRSNQENISFNCFETTFSPLISPNLSETQSNAQNSLVQPAATTSNILSWNPESPINQMESIYNSVSSQNERNRETPTINILRSDELIQKMTSLSKQKDKKQKSLNEKRIFGISSGQFGKAKGKQSFAHEKQKQQKMQPPPRLRPLSRVGIQTVNEGSESTKPEEERVLNLSFEESNNFFNRSSFLNKKNLASSERLDLYKGRKDQK